MDEFEYTVLVWDDIALVNHDNSVKYSFVRVISSPCKYCCEFVTQCRPILKTLYISELYDLNGKVISTDLTTLNKKIDINTELNKWFMLYFMALRYYVKLCLFIYHIYWIAKYVEPISLAGIFPKDDSISLTSYQVEVGNTIENCDAGDGQPGHNRDSNGSSHGSDSSYHEEHNDISHSDDDSFNEENNDGNDKRDDDGFINDDDEDDFISDDDEEEDGDEEELESEEGNRSSDGYSKPQTRGNKYKRLWIESDDEDNILENQRHLGIAKDNSLENENYPTCDSSFKGQVTSNVLPNDSKSNKGRQTNYYSSDSNSCSEKYIQKANVCHSANAFQCYKCEFKTYAQHPYNCHVISAHFQLKPYACVFCDFETVSKYVMRKHIRCTPHVKPTLSENAAQDVSTEQPLSSPSSNTEITSSYPNNSGALKLNKKESDDDKTALFKCSICSFISQSKIGLKIHESSKRHRKVLMNRKKFK